MRSKNRLFSLLALGLIAIAGVIFALHYLRDRSPHPPDNVILIVMDALRADHLSCNGYQTSRSVPLTPNIDRLAREGINFKNAFCHISLTLPSMSTLFTSLYPSVHGIRSNEGRLPDAAVTLAEVFQRNDYKTAAFVSGGYVKSEFGLSRGFDIYVDNYDKITNLSKKAVKWLKETGPTKFFMYFHALETHVPYNPPDEYKIPDDYSWDHIWAGSIQFVDKYKKANLQDIYNQEGFAEKVVRLYDGEIKYADTEWGAFFDELRSLGLYDDTLIILTADHGEELGEHGEFGHKKLYEETTRVPLIMKLPGKQQKIANRVIDSLVGHIDIMPTMNGLAKMPFPDYPLQGRNLWPLLKGKKTRDRTIFMERGNLLGLRTKDYKLLMGPQARPPLEFYDLAKDPQEKSDLSASAEKDTVSAKRKLVASLGQINQENERLALRFTGKNRKASSPEDREKRKSLEEDLRSLGYIR